MNERLFRKKNKADWAKLESYAVQIDRGGHKGIPQRELPKFITLYRKVCGDLARARTYRASPELIDRLNRLVGRVHLRVYAAERLPISRMGGFILRGLPRTIRKEWPFVLISALLLLLPAIVAYLATVANPHLGHAFAPVGYIEQMEQAFGESFGKEDRGSGMGAVATSFYISNNIQVSFFAFALGIFWGIGSAFILVFNGAMLGGVAAVSAQFGIGHNFWSFVSSHGGIELGAIVLSGAAGLRIGYALINPGRFKRQEALVRAGQTAGMIMFGVILMLIVAAFLEGFVSPSTLPNLVKNGIGIVMLLAMFYYYIFFGRKRIPADVPV